MMTIPQKAVRKIIDTLSSDYIGARFRYQYNESNNTHVVEVTPLSLFEDDGYSDCEFDFVIGFEKKYGETLLFVSENSLTKVTNPIYEKIINEPDFSYSDDPIIGNLDESFKSLSPINMNEEIEKEIEDARDKYIAYQEEQIRILNENIAIIKQRIDYPFDRIKEYLCEEGYWHLGYVNVFEETEYKSCSYPGYKHYSVLEEDNKKLGERIPKYLMRQDDNKEDTFHNLVWQTCGIMGDDYSGFILFPLTDGTYWALRFEC